MNKTFKIKSDPIHHEVTFGDNEISIRSDKWGLGQDVWNVKCPKSELSEETTIQTAFGWRAWPAMRMAIVYFIVGILFIYQFENWVKYIGYLFLILMVIAGARFLMKLKKTQWINILRKNGTRVAAIAFTRGQDTLKEEFLEAYKSYLGQSTEDEAEQSHG